MESFRLYNMTYDEKKTLYESIMKEVAEIVKRKLNETASKEEIITDQYLDEDNNIKIEFTIKSISDEESMFYYSAFVYATLEIIGDLFLRTLFLNNNNKKRIEWEQKQDDDMIDKIDDMAFKLYKKSLDVTDGHMFAKKIKEVAPSLGFDFSYKIIEDE